MGRVLFSALVSFTAARGVARAGDDPALPAAPAPAPDPPPVPPDRSPEVIEMTGATPAEPGAIKLDAGEARRAPGALGEPLRAIALLPGVVTSIAASGSPIIRGTLPGESRFTFDGIEMPMLYHFAIGNQVIHPSFIGELELRAGGHGAEQGNLIGGLVAMTASAPDATRTELRANPIEVGVYRFQALSKATSIAAAARVGTLGLVKFIKPDYDLYYVDQQTRLVHRLGNGDQLTLTSLAAFDKFGRPDVGITLQSDKFGFHRLDGRWTRARHAWTLRAGLETQIDAMRSKTVYEPPPSPPGAEPTPAQPTDFRGGAAYGVRGYADASASLAAWLRVRGGIEARHRSLDNGRSPFDLFTESHPDPYLGHATRVDAGGAWAAFDLRISHLTITPGVRGDFYRAELYAAAARHTTLDPRLTVRADLPAGVRAELSAGRYSAPPQISVLKHDMLVGPLPVTDGLGSNAGMNHAVETEASLHAPLASDLEASAAVYYRNTHRAIDFGVVHETFYESPRCSDFPAPYRDLETRSMGAELMVRGDVTRSLAGWLAYSLAKNDRDFGFIRLPADYDQRHTLNATAQWRRAAWSLGATGHLHTGRAILFPSSKPCRGDDILRTSLDEFRRPPLTWRLDLRAERAYQFTSWRMSVYVEVQNATLTKETVNYVAESGNVEAHKVFLPLATIGLEAAR